MNVLKGIHQFKIIVDKKWVCSSQYSIIIDKNNSNNIIDLTNYSHIFNNNNKNYNMDKSHIKKEIESIKRDKLNLVVHFLTSQRLILSHLEHPKFIFLRFNLNNQSKQEYLESHFKYNLELNKRKSIFESKTFKDISVFPYYQLSHICYSMGNENNWDKDNYIRTAITQRIKHKFLLIIYFTNKWWIIILY